MTSLRDPHRYREQAAHFRELAVTITDSRELRDSYLALSLEYERLAQILEKSAAATLVKRSSQAYIAGMADKPDPQNPADRYSEEETDRRMDATVRAMIGLKPKPHQPIKPNARSMKKRSRASC